MHTLIYLDPVLHIGVKLICNDNTKNMSWKKSDYKILKIIKIHLKVNKKTCIYDKRLLLQDLSFHFFSVKLR